MLFFGLELPDTIAYKRTEAFVDFNFTFLFVSSRASLPMVFFRLRLVEKAYK